MAYPGVYRYSNVYDWKGENGEKREAEGHFSPESERDARDRPENVRRSFNGPKSIPYRGNRYIPGIHEESDFTFGSDYIQDERSFRPSRMRRDSGSRSWINVGDSAYSGDSGGRSYTSNEYIENPAYYEGDTGGESGQTYVPPAGFRNQWPFGMSSYPRYFKESFAGRGPKGYQRSDQRITEDVCERLTQDPEIDASGITVETKNGEVMLEGTVTDRESKRRADDIAASCSGVIDVQNKLRIQRS